MGLKTLGAGDWTGVICLRIGPGGSICECGNTVSVSIKGEEFYEQLSDY
jgi:hypothetical protein